MLTGLAIAAGWLGDRALGEPPVSWHPVARFGTLMSAIEPHTYRPTRAAGAVHTAIGIGLAWAVGRALERSVGRRLAVAIATEVCVAGRMLVDEVAAVAAALDRDDLPAARARVGGVVGRRTDDLDSAGVVRAAIESLAENTVDAVVAPIVWAVVAGAPGVLAHRAVNTLDAMIGHRTERYQRFGWAAARLDDLANFVPARLAMIAVALVRPDRVGAISRTVRRDAPAHPSPNGGVIEAAVAAALGRRLGGANRYGDVVEERGALGAGPAPDVGDVSRAIRLTSAATVAVIATVAVVR